MMRKTLPVFAVALLGACGQGSGGASTGEPVRVAECTEWLRGQLARPDTAATRLAEAWGTGTYRFTKITFNGLDAAGTRHVCYANCRLRGDDEQFDAADSKIGFDAPGNSSLPCPLLKSAAAAG